MSFLLNKNDKLKFNKAIYFNTNDNEGLEEENVNTIDDLNLDELSMPFTETWVEFVQELLEEKFLIDDLSFVFEISRQHTISPYTLILGMIYLKRLKKSTTAKCQYTLSSQELCLVSLIVASKYLVDEGEFNEIYNNDWAKVTNVSVAKINNLEKSMLNDLNWELYVPANEFWQFLQIFNFKLTSRKIQLQNNMCTYTDMSYLLANEVFLKKFQHEILNYLLKIFTTQLITLTYALYTGLLAFSLVNVLLRNTTLVNNRVINTLVVNHNSSLNINIMPTLTDSLVLKLKSSSSHKFISNSFENESIKLLIKNILVEDKNILIFNSVEKTNLFNYTKILSDKSKEEIILINNYNKTTHDKVKLINITN